MQERGLSLREGISKAPIIIRWPIYMTAIFIVLVFGYYGEGFDAASFIYAGF